jgi:hypothetical protein
MTHDHEAVQLAIASIDFELTPSELTRMEAGLAACPECATAAASHLEVARLFERLPLHEAAPIVRQRVLRSALVPPRTRQWQVLLAAAALVGLLLAGAVAAGAFRTDPLQRKADVQPPSPSALGDVLSPDPSTSASVTVSASASPLGLRLTPNISNPTPDEQLLVEAIPAVLLNDCVRSRTAPSDPEIQGDVAAIDCPVVDSTVTEARYFLFDSPAQLRAWWQTDIKNAGLQPDSGGCPVGREGETAFDRGRLQCFQSPDGARLRWLDDDRLVYGMVSSGSDDVRATVEWWTQTHRITGVRAEPSFIAVEQGLVDEAPPDIVGDCVPYRVVGKEATAVEGSLGAIDCLVASSLVIDVGYFRFPTLSALDGWWDKRLPGLPVRAGSGGCLDGTRGETGTARGRIACYVSDGEARIRWTDEVRLVYGALNGQTKDLARLFKWWDDRHER